MNPENEIREPALVESGGGAVLMALFLVSGLTVGAAVIGSIVVAVLVGVALLGFVGLVVAAV
ncbi:hypothetical protein ACNHUS_03495 [Actinomycetes bacterium M1A6_2h]